MRRACRRNDLLSATRTFVFRTILYNPPGSSAIDVLFAISPGCRPLFTISFELLTPTSSSALACTQLVQLPPQIHTRLWFEHHPCHAGASGSPYAQVKRVDSTSCAGYNPASPEKHRNKKQESVRYRYARFKTSLSVCLSFCLSVPTSSSFIHARQSGASREARAPSYESGGENGFLYEPSSKTGSPLLVFGSLGSIAASAQQPQKSDADVPTFAKELARSPRPRAPTRAQRSIRLRRNRASSSPPGHRPRARLRSCRPRRGSSPTSPG